MNGAVRKSCQAMQQKILNEELQYQEVLQAIYT